MLHSEQLTPTVDMQYNSLGVLRCGKESSAWRTVAHPEKSLLLALDSTATTQSSRRKLFCSYNLIMTQKRSSHQSSDARTKTQRRA